MSGAGTHDIQELARSNERLREQQDAISSVLRAVVRSAELQPVLDEVTTAAMRLCAGQYGMLYLAEGGPPTNGSANSRTLRRSSSWSSVSRKSIVLRLYHPSQRHKRRRENRAETISPVHARDAVSAAGASLAGCRLQSRWKATIALLSEAAGSPCVVKVCATFDLISGAMNRDPMTSAS